MLHDADYEDGEGWISLKVPPEYERGDEWAKFKKFSTTTTAAVVTPIRKGNGTINLPYPT